MKTVREYLADCGNDMEVILVAFEEATAKLYHEELEDCIYSDRNPAHPEGVGNISSDDWASFLWHIDDERI